MYFYLQLIESDAEKTKFEQIYVAYKDLMLYVASRILGNMNDTEDVVHQAFLKIIEILDKIDEPVAPKTRALVVTITERKAIDMYRYRKRKTTVSIDEESINVPERLDMERLHGKLDLAAAMAMLPARYRQVLLLRYDWGFSEEETAGILCIAQENVHKTVQRAKKKLREMLGNEV